MSETQPEHSRWMSATEVRAEWASVLRAARTGEPVTITQHGEPVAVVVDIATYRRLREIQDGEDAADLAAADEARARIAAGETPVPLADLAAEVARLVTPEILAEVRAELGHTR
jgi:prevent-host-death family protein